VDHVLVTGGAGFIGSHVVDALLAAGHEVTILDSLDPGAHAEHPDYLDERARLVLGDVRDRSAWDDALDGVGAVCHQAGKVGLGVDFGDVDAYVTSNDVGFAVGLRALHDRRFTGPVVLASSMVVYGEGRYRCGVHGTVRPAPRLVSDLEAGRFEPPCPTCGAPLAAEAVPEYAPLDPRNVYAATKLHQEHLLAAFVREHPLTATVLRYHNVYGPRMPQRTPYAGVASVFRSALEAGQAPRVTEDGAQRRNFVHVDDVARANLAAVQRPGSGLLTCNVGSAESRTVGEMATALAAAFGAEPGDERWPVVTGAYRLGDVRHVFADVERARAALGFVAAVGFEEGMRRFATDPLRTAVADS
jgi:dTDP-L-rhamnose 4-epimerase